MKLTRSREEGIPFSLSRWTDVPQAKWAWFLQQMEQGHMICFDPRTGIPSRWSLAPEDTLGMVWWTKDPKNLIDYAETLRKYDNLVINVTLTGWEEVEKGAPNLSTGAQLLARAAEVFGPKRVNWRFSPVPMVQDTVSRFERIARLVYTSGIDRVFLSFLQENDRVPETRSSEERVELMRQMAEIGAKFAIKVLLCNEDRTLAGLDPHWNLSAGVCADPKEFEAPASVAMPSEGCGCILMADPFTVNESCTMGCTYCYASDQTLAEKKRNTTRTLPVLR